MTDEFGDSLEWTSVAQATYNVRLAQELPELTSAGVVAFTDGSCIKNPGGPAGWSALLWSASDFVGNRVREAAPCFECYGHIPRAQTTTNNRAEISAVLAVLSLAPLSTPLKIFSDSEYTIKVAQGTFQMKANPELWSIYRKLLSFRKAPVTFEWVRGHAGHLHNERADELAGLGAWNGDQTRYEQWQNSQAHEAHNRPQRKAHTRVEKKALPPQEQSQLHGQILKLQTYFAGIDPESGRISAQERKFVQDMARRMQDPKFALSDKQLGWLKGIMSKHHV